MTGRQTKHTERQTERYRGERNSNRKRRERVSAFLLQRRVLKRPAVRCGQHGTQHYLMQGLGHLLLQGRLPLLGDLWTNSIMPVTPSAPVVKFCALMSVTDCVPASTILQVCSVFLPVSSPLHKRSVPSL